MSVLIKDMEKPKYCYAVIDGMSEYCPFINKDDDCVLLLIKGICRVTWEEQYSKCPLVETPEPCEDAVSRAELLHIFEENCYPVHYDHNSIDAGMTLPGIVEVLNIATSVTPKRKTGKWELIYKEPENDAWACNVTARCSCCGKPLKTLGDRIGWGNDRNTGETIIWSGFITNWKQHKEQAKIFALNAGESVSDDLFPKYCENCGADMRGEQNDNDK